MYNVQNRQKRAWIVPPTTSHKALVINPGAVEPVADEHWEQVIKGNRVIEALMTGRHIVVSRSASVLEQGLHSDELSNPKPPAAPDELTEKDDRVTIESKVEVKEVIIDDAPKEGKGPNKK